MKVSHLHSNRQRLTAHVDPGLEGAAFASPDPGPRVLLTGPCGQLLADHGDHGAGGQQVEQEQAQLPAEVDVDAERGQAG